MKALVKGHEYKLNVLDGNGYESINFVNRNEGQEKEGTTNQEVLRVLIDRVKFLDNQIQHEVNDKIIYHLRMAIVLHEARHLERLVEKQKLNPEELNTGKDGHFVYER